MGEEVRRNSLTHNHAPPGAHPGKGESMSDSLTGDYDFGDDGLDFDEYSGVSVMCGKCYRLYDPLENMDGKCPSCGSEEIVGDR